MAPVHSRPFFALPLFLAALISVAPILAASAPALAQSPDRLIYLTEEYYPFNYSENGQVKGLSVDVLHMVWERLHLQEQSIEVLPWARAYELASHQPGTVLFTVARTPERAALFRWAGPIASARVVLIAKKSRKIRISSIDRLGGYCIGTVRGDVAHTLLSPYLNECTLEAVSDMKQNIRKLLEDRLDLVAYEEHSWPALSKRLGVDPNQFESVFLLRETPIYFAFHPDTPAETVAAFQQALDAVKATPRFAELMRAYR